MVSAVSTTLPTDGKVKFSIVIPVYNCGELVLDALESVLKQDFCSYEVILVDDGSDDFTAGVCDRASLANGRVKVFHQDNTGQYQARRKGYEHASGEIIVSLDADDIIKPNMLETLAKVFSNQDIDVVIFDGEHDDVRQTPIRRLPFRSGDTFENFSKQQLYRLFCEGTLLNNVYLLAFRNDKKLLASSFKDIHIRRGEDLVQAAEIITNAKRVQYLSASLYVYRHNENSVTNTFYTASIEDLSTAVNCLESLSLNWHMKDAKVLLVKKLMRGFAFQARQIVFKHQLKDARIRLMELSEFLYSFESTLIEVPRLSGVDGLVLALLRRKRYLLLYLLLRIGNRFRSLV